MAHGVHFVEAGHQRILRRQRVPRLAVDAQRVGRRPGVVLVHLVAVRALAFAATLGVHRLDRSAFTASTAPFTRTLTALASFEAIR
jgi:hypothetical protein